MFALPGTLCSVEFRHELNELRPELLKSVYLSEHGGTSLNPDDNVERIRHRIAESLLAHESNF
jgi:hypothetical protein